MRGIKAKSRESKPDLYKIQNNKDVSKFIARKKLSPADAADRI